MDMDEAMQEFVGYVLEHGSDEAATIAIDADADMAGIDEDEMYFLLMEFGDDYGWDACRLVTIGIFGSDGT